LSCLLINTRIIPNFSLQSEDICDAGVFMFLKGEKQIIETETLSKTFNQIGGSFGITKNTINSHIDDIFSAPRANLLIAIENIGLEKGKKCQKTTSISSFTTLLTGTKESKHQIFGKVWPKK